MRTWIAIFLAAGTVWGAPPRPMTPRQKVDMIMDLKARRGSVVVFTAKEIEELGREEIPRVVPDGFREPGVALGTNTATGTALIDFKRLRHAQGNAPSWLDNLIEGERPVRVDIQLQSAKGWATVTLTRLEISKIAATGRVLDVLVKAFFLSLLPDAKINEPFRLKYNIDHLEIRPGGLYVTIKK